MKRLVGLALCLMLMLTAVASAEVYVVHYSAPEQYYMQAMLLRDDGTVLADRGQYASLWQITPEGTPEAARLYSAEPWNIAPETIHHVVEDDYDYDYVDFREALVDAEGHALTGFDYYSLDYCPAVDAVLFRLPDHRQGIMDRQGNVIVEADYASIAPTGEGGYLALLAPESGELEYETVCPLAVISPEGEVRETGYHAGSQSLGQFEDGTCLLYDVVEEGGRTVILNARGENLFNVAFAYTMGFQGALAIVQRDSEGGYGLIDRQGRVVAPLEYRNVFLSNTGCYVGDTDDYVDFYDAETGERLARRESRGHSMDAWDAGGFVLISEGDDYSLYDGEGNVLLDARNYMDFSPWYSKASGTPQRVIASRGDYPDTMYWLEDFDGNTYGVKRHDMYGALWKDGHGRYTFSTFKTYMEDGQKNVAWQSYRTGVCDEDGNTLLDSVYSNVDLLDLDRYWVRQGARTGLVDSEGHWYYTIYDYEDLMD